MSRSGSINSLEATFAEASGGYVIAPAGCGKTELIAKALSRSSGRQLILTHTHAGVRALRARLRKYQIDSKSYSLDTIAGFALRYCLGFPRLSGFNNPQPVDDAWTEAYQALSELLRRAHVRDILSGSYDGVYIDEYQDCTRRQHAAIRVLAEALPVRIVGDPLQGIFGFGDDPAVDWSSVESDYSFIGELATPHRWHFENSDLGEWLLVVRDDLLNGSPLRLEEAPIDLRFDSSVAEQVRACREVARRVEGSIVGIRRWPPAAHDVASRLSGQFLSMEEMQCRDLLDGAEEFEVTSGPDRASCVIDFAAMCMTRVRARLGVAVKRFSAGQVARPTRGRAAKAVAALIEVADAESLQPVVGALREIAAIDDVRVYRSELVREMIRSIESFEDGGYESLKEAAWSIRDGARQQTRRLPRHLISRTLLIKGLEFDHALVLDANEHGPRELYVSLTRASRSLTVLVDPNRPLPGGRRW